MLYNFAIICTLPVYVVGMILIRIKNFFLWIFKRDYKSEVNPYYKWDEYCMENKYMIAIVTILYFYFLLSILPELSLIETKKP